MDNWMKNLGLMGANYKSFMSKFDEKYTIRKYYKSSQKFVPFENRLKGFLSYGCIFDERRTYEKKT